MRPQDPVEVDPFDLPDWLGEREVVWTSETGLRTGHRVPGRLVSSPDEIACDLVAVDEAYPQPVTATALRSSAHQAWQHGQIHLASYDGRLALLVPGTSFDADRALEAVGRLARAVGASPVRYAVQLRVSDH